MEPGPYIVELPDEPDDTIVGAPQDENQDQFQSDLSSNTNLKVSYF